MKRKAPAQPRLPPQRLRHQRATFDYQQEPTVLADLVLCALVVEREAREQARACRRTTPILVGAWHLHTPGLGSMKPVKKMRRDRILQELGFADPYVLPDESIAS